MKPRSLAALGSLTALIVGIAGCSGGSAGQDLELNGQSPDNGAVSFTDDGTWDTMKIVRADMPTPEARNDYADFATLRFDDECFYLEHHHTGSRFIPVFYWDTRPVQDGDMHGVELPNGTVMWEDGDYSGDWQFYADVAPDMVTDPEQLATWEECDRRVDGAGGYVIVYEYWPDIPQS